MARRRTFTTWFAAGLENLHFWGNVGSALGEAMIRVSRPFNRWFDLADRYDDAPPRPAAEESQRPEAHREWTYETPKRDEPAPRQEPETPRPPC